MELVYSLAKGESTAQPNVSSYRIATKLKATGATNRFRNVNLGKIYFTTAGKQKVELRFKGDTPIVRAVILRPAPEGEVISQALDRSILLHSRDATIHGVKVQYENKPHKNTLGFWVNTSDQVYWDFSVESGGKFDIEIHQGCGQATEEARSRSLLPVKPMSSPSRTPVIFKTSYHAKSAPCG